MDRISRIAAGRSEAPVPTDLLASLLMEEASERSTAAAKSSRLPLKVYGVMAVTTVLTFLTLTTGYQTLFTQQVFA